MMKKEEHKLGTKIEINLLDGVEVDEICGFRPQNELMSNNGEDFPLRVRLFSKRQNDEMGGRSYALCFYIQTPR